MNNDYYFYEAHSKSFLKTVRPRKVELLGWESYDFFAFRMESGQWVVCEAKTGMIVSHPGMHKNTRQGAIDSFSARLKNLAGDPFEMVNNAIKNAIAEHGISPRYQEEVKA